MTPQPFLIVVPCLNEAAELPWILDQLLAQPLAGLIVVSDGGSTDGSRDIVAAKAKEQRRVRLLVNPKRIQSAAINLAIREYGAAFSSFVRIDAHCRYPDDYLARLAHAARQSEAQSVVVPMTTVAEGGFQQAIALAQNSVLGTGGSAHRSVGTSGWVDHGHHALMEIATFVRAGGYCEALRCNEDAELDHRFAQVGGRIWLDAECAIDYFPRRTPLALARQYFRYGDGRAQNIRRHRTRPHPRQILPLGAIGSLLLLPASIFHWTFALPALAWLGISILSGVLLGLQHRTKWGLLSGMAAVIMHASWSMGFVRGMMRSAHTFTPRYGFAPSYFAARS